MITDNYKYGLQVCLELPFGERVAYYTEIDLRDCGFMQPVDVITPKLMESPCVVLPLMMGSKTPEEAKVIKHDREKLAKHLGNVIARSLMDHIEKMDTENGYKKE